MSQLLSAINAALTLEDLQPSQVVNDTFSKLVDTIIHTDQKALHDVSAKVASELRTRCAQAESALEFYWSQRISESENSHSELRQFPYWENYHILASQEINLAQIGLPVHVIPHRCLIIGSGPLPMTAVHLQHLLGERTVIDHVDTSRAALAAAELFWRKTVQTAGNFIHGDGQSVSLGPDTYDFILIAALAGETVAQKQAIIDNVLPALRADGRIIVRSAVGARSLLYPSFHPSELHRVHHLASYHPDNEVINSIYIYKKERS